jgi:hypothetical protein
MGEQGMAKLWSLALALMIGAGLWAAPAMAQSSDVDDVGKIERGGAEDPATTTLGEKGLVFSNAAFEVRMTTRVQFRLTYQNEVANGNNGTNGRDFVNFRVRRAKTKFSGHIFDKQFKYELLLNWATGGDGIVEEAIFTWALMNEFNVNAGQQKLQFNWEEATSSGAQQFVDRSYTNEAFNVDYGKGIWVNGRVGDDVPFLKYWFGVYNGVLKANNDFRNADGTLRSDTFSNLVDTEMMINLRLETHPLGEVARSMYDGRGEDERNQVLFAIGLGLNWFMSGFNDAGIRGDTVATPTGSGRFRTSHDTLAIVLDGHLRVYGLSVDMELFFRHTEFHNRGRNRFNPSNPTRSGTGNLSDVGFSFLIAYMILPDTLNVGIRFNLVNGDEVWQGGATTQRFGVRPDATELGLSVNYFVHGDNLKLTLDILMVSQQVPLALSSTGLVGVYNAPPSRTAASISGEVGDHNDLWLIRLQLQWIF